MEFLIASLVLALLHIRKLRKDLEEQKWVTKVMEDSALRKAKRINELQVQLMIQKSPRLVELRRSAP